MYTATDVRDLHEWMVEHADAHPLFRRLSDEELLNNECVRCAMQETEEGIKVARNSGDKFLAVYERIEYDATLDWHGYKPLKDNPLLDQDDEKVVEL